MNIRRDSPSPPSPRRSRALLLSIGTSRRGQGRAISMRRSTATKRCIYHTLEFHPRSRPSRQANRTLSLGGFPYPFQERDALISPARKERMTPTPKSQGFGHIRRKRSHPGFSATKNGQFPPQLRQNPLSSGHEAPNPLGNARSPKAPGNRTPDPTTRSVVTRSDSKPATRQAIEGKNEDRARIKR